MCQYHEIPFLLVMVSAVAGACVGWMASNVYIVLTAKDESKG